MPINAVRSMPFALSLQMTAAKATAPSPEANPYAQGDGGPGAQQGALPASLRQKLIGKVPGAISLESLTPPDVPTLRTAAIQARQPKGVTHDEALRVRRTALVQLQTGAQPGSPVAAVAGATLAILDGSAGVGQFRLTEFTDRVLDWVATTTDSQFAVTPGATVADGLRALIKGLVETRGVDATADGPLYQATLTQAARVSAPGSHVASLVHAHEQLAKQLSSPRDKAQLAEMALNELTGITAYDVLAGGTPKALRALAKHANWALTVGDADRITLKSAALRTIANSAPPNARVGFIANDALRLVASASSITEQDFALKSALETIAVAGDSEF